VKRHNAAWRTWLVQRASALYMLCFIAFVLGHFAIEPPRDYPAWHAWMLSFGVSVATTAFFVALVVHAWIGLHDVLMDYVHAVVIRISLLALLGFGLTAVAVWIVRILWIQRG
jgi:succinate dehydrogenase / fumarate reductase, membrane anchor subunit